MVIPCLADRRVSLSSASSIFADGWRFARPGRHCSPGHRLVSFLAGLILLWLALGPPMDDFADALLSAHMVEHLLLMSAVPPLLLYGLPVVPMLRGLPVPFRTYVVSPLLRLSSLRAFGRWIVNPVVAWLAMNLTFLVWHIPSAYDAALRNEVWHVVEHLCFLATSLLFWWCILRPWPTAANRPNWGISDLPDIGGCGEYPAFSVSGFLQPSGLQRTTLTVQMLLVSPLRRSGPGSRDHVGYRFTRFPDSCTGHYR